MTRAAGRGRGERGFTLVEILASLVITMIGLAGVLMMQASTARSNRDSGQFTRAANIAEETMESARGTSVTELMNPNLVYDPQVHNEITYNIELTAAEIAGNSNLVMITVAVTFDVDELGSGERTAKVQMIRTKTERL